MTDKKLRDILPFGPSKFVSV